MENLDASSFAPIHGTEHETLPYGVRHKILRYMPNLRENLGAPDTHRPRWTQRQVHASGISTSAVLAITTRPPTACDPMSVVVSRGVIDRACGVVGSSSSLAELESKPRLQAETPLLFGNPPIIELLGVSP
ncbi:hypothetical protein C8R45DRAFT_1096456 [Mycena sanguinolenta]|nr:hypothetical protein C8R45DRAFT_1096456 [Mycena sanguinolenta]